MTDITIEPSRRVKFEKGPAFVFDTFDFKDVSYTYTRIFGVATRGRELTFFSPLLDGLTQKEAALLFSRHVRRTFIFEVCFMRFVQTERNVLKCVHGSDCSASVC